MRFIRLLFLVLLFSPNFLFAKDDENSTRQMAVTANLGNMWFGNFEVRYELKLNPRVSLSFPINFVHYKAALVSGIISKSIGGSIGAELKIHVFGEALKGGAYIAPTAKFGFIDHPTDDRNDNLTQELKNTLPDGALDTYFRNNGWIRTGAIFGYDWVHDSGLMLDINAGLEYYYFIRATKQNLIRPVFAASIGYAW